MSRRTGRSAAPQANPKPPQQGRLGADYHATRRGGFLHPSRWFLAMALLLQAAWIAFLITMAWR